MEQGFDPDIKRYFKKIINSLSWGLLWMIGSFTAGIYFRLAFRAGKPLLVTVIFYLLFTISLLALLRYYYRLWKK
jgi:hypothetical protein